jgi:hypothetical protein
MAAKKSSTGKDNTVSAEANRASAAVSAAVAPDASAFREQDEQMVKEMNELKDLVRSLAAAVEQTQARSAHTAVIQNTANEISRIARAIPAAAGYGVTPQSAPVKEDCGGDCGPCGCVESSCCCFDIYVDSVRAIQPQGPLEPGDSGDIPGLANPLEVQFTATVDAGWGPVGFIYPNLWTTIDLRVGSVLLGGKPGPWSPINQVINRVCIKKGTTRIVPVKFTAIEREVGIAEVPYLKDEFGEAIGSITLDCCMENIYPAMPADISFDHGGIGGGAPGMISIAYYARRVCC